MNAALGELRIMVPGLSGASAGEFKLEVSGERRYKRGCC